MRWTCDCGAVELDVATDRTTRVVCYCPDCRGFLERLGRSDWLDPAGGSDLLQIAPEDARLTRGGDKLYRTRLTAKGPLRWFTSCCRTPVGNTLPMRAVPFLSLQARPFGDRPGLPPVDARVFRRHATARAPEGGRQVRALQWAFLRRALRSRLTGGWRRNPFFDDAGRPVGREAQLEP